MECHKTKLATYFVAAYEKSTKLVEQSKCLMSWVQNFHKLSLFLNDNFFVWIHAHTFQKHLSWPSRQKMCPYSLLYISEYAIFHVWMHQARTIRNVTILLVAHVLRCFWLDISCKNASVPGIVENMKFQTLKLINENEGLKGS